MSSDVGSGPADGERSDTAPAERPSLRHRRAAALIALAVLVMASASTVYLYSAVPRPETPIPATVIDPLLVTSYEISYNFATPLLGWAAVSLVAPSSQAGAFEVFHTVDGAKHWQPQFQSQISFSGLVPFSVRLFDKTHGFMTIGNPVQQLYRTTDAGVEWSLIRLPPSPRIDNITFSDETYGWMLAAPASGSDHVGNLYATGDAGDTWQRLPDPPGDSNTLIFRGPSDAWLGSAGLGQPHVYTSGDAGQSWQRHDLPAPLGGSWDPARGPFQVTGQLLPGAGVIMSVVCPCAQSGLFDFTSFDGGLTWRYFQTARGNVAYQDGVHWWAIDGTVLLKSADAGQTWTQVTDRLPDWHYLPHVLDSRNAWADLATPVGGGLALTNDGGLRWIRGTVPQLTR